MLLAVEGKYEFDFSYLPKSTSAFPMLVSRGSEILSTIKAAGQSLLFPQDLTRSMPV
jgi:hypothetical protein